MLKLTIAIAGLAVISGCGEVRDRDISQRDTPDRPLEIARVERIRPMADSAVLAAETRPSEPSPAPQPAEAAKPAPDSELVPDIQPPPEPPPEPPPAPESRSERRAEPDTAAYAPYPTAEPAADTAESSSADTTAQPADTGSPPAPGPDPAPAPRPDSAPAPSTNAGGAPAAAGTLAAGTVIHAALEDSIHSRHDVSGKVVAGRVMQNVTGRDGLTLIPAGAPVQFTVTQVKPGKGDRPGVLEMRVDAITIEGQPRKLEARIEPVSHELRGRGVTGNEAAKVGVGAAGGAVVGRVIGGNTKGAVIGGVVGAAGGAVVASKTASRDVVVKARTPVVFVLTAPLVAGR